MIPVLKSMSVIDKLLFFLANRLYQHPCKIVRDRFLKDYRCASENARNKWNTETYFALRAFAKHNDAVAIREIYQIGYPGFYYQDEEWTEPTFAGIAAENRNYEALQALADSGEDVSWYGSITDQYTWKFVIENNDAKMCAILAKAKCRVITDIAAAFILEHCHELVPDLVKNAKKEELCVWHRVADALSDQEIVTLCKNQCGPGELKENDHLETLTETLKYTDVANIINKSGVVPDASCIWNTIFDVDGRAPECYSYDFFYSNELTKSRRTLMDVLFKKNIRPQSQIVTSIIRSDNWRLSGDSVLRNSASAVIYLLEHGVYSYDGAMQDAIRNRALTVIQHLIDSGSGNMNTGGLCYMLADHTQFGFWPKILAHPLGRLLRFDLLSSFRKEHDPCFEKVTEILMHAHKRGMLDINEKHPRSGETALLHLCKDAFPQGLRMPCMKKLISVMIDIGADPSIPDNTGKTAYDYAKEKRASPAILNLLCTLA